MLPFFSKALHLADHLKGVPCASIHKHCFEFQSSFPVFKLLRHLTLAGVSISYLDISAREVSNSKNVLLVGFWFVSSLLVL
jgi:hypothetical protein